MGVRLEILGPLRLWRDGVQADAGPRQQALLLALLLTRAGQPVSTGELVDLIWGDDAPASALNVIQKYVGGLRRVLEPELSARGPGSYLHRHGNGYVFRPTPGMLDLVTFRELVAAARAERSEVALDLYLDALRLWRGPAGGGLGEAASFAAVDDEFFEACVAAVECAIPLGRVESVLPAVRRAAVAVPLHEPVQATVIRALAAAGRRPEALATFDAVRDRLADELGIEPGPALQTVHRRSLARPGGPAAASVRRRGRPARPAAGLVGRAEELQALDRSMDSALFGGTGLGVIEGEPGVGKTRLVGEITAEAARQGMAVVQAASPDGDGTPSMWPWVRAVTVLLDTLPAAERDRWLAGELGRLVEPGDGVAAPALPDGGAQFRLFEEVVALLGRTSAQQPTVLFIDDLQWSDAASLQMFGHLAGRLPGGSALIGALRNRAPAPGSELSRMLAAVSRVPGHRRIALGPLDRDEVTELIRRETGESPGPDIARTVFIRTAGNPFFVRELSRFLADGGVLSGRSASVAGVPSTVRDVVRDRMAGLDDDVQELLRLAAFIGRDVDLGLLADAARARVDCCLERLEPVEARGLIEFEPGDPFAFHFAHDLVRESVAETTPPREASALHLRIADVLERHDPTGEFIAERLAHHLWQAGPLADPDRTANALIRAAARATAKSALEAAERQLRTAVEVARKAGLTELELTALTQLTAVVGMRSMFGAAVRDLLERAEQLARELGRERAAADFLFSRWTTHTQAIELDRSAPLARRLYEQGEASDDPVVRDYGLYAWGIQMWSTGRIGEAYRCLTRSGLHLVRRDEEALRHDLQILATGLLAETLAIYGEVTEARARVDALEATAGDDPYVVTMWTTFAVRIAVLIGDPVWALGAAERGIAVDPDFTFRFLGTYQRLARHWALAVTGHDPAGAAVEVEKLIGAMLLDPPRSCVSTWFGLLAEMRLAAGQPEQASTALDRAFAFLDSHQQRYSEGLLLLQRARVLAALGAPAEEVRAAAIRARALSIEREAHLFARRAAEFLGATAGR